MKQELQIAWNVSTLTVTAVGAVFALLWLLDAAGVIAWA